jgi:hypothetical protein
MRDERTNCKRNVLNRGGERLRKKVDAFARIIGMHDLEDVSTTQAQNRDTHNLNELCTADRDHWKLGLWLGSRPVNKHRVWTWVCGTLE